MVRERRAAKPETERRSRKREPGSIWDTPRLKEILAEPVGAPIELTREEALAIIEEHLASPKPYDARKAERDLRWLKKIRRESGAILVRPDRDA
jgi:hypothetical protein